MRRRILVVSVATALALGCQEQPLDPWTGGPPALSVAAAGEYALTDLGTLGGRFSCASDVTNSGLVVGISEDAAGEVLPFVWSAADGMWALPKPAGLSGHPTQPRISEDGTVVSALNTSGVIWDAAGTARVLPLPAGFSSAWAVDINDHDVVLGQGWGPAGGRLILWTDQVPSVVEDITGTSLHAIALNNRGDILAREMFDSFVRLADGTVVEPENVEPGLTLWSFDISDDRVVAGLLMNSSSRQRPMIWRVEEGVVQDISGDAGSGSAFAIAGSGAVTGYLNASGGTYAFVWTESTGATLLPKPTLHGFGYGISESGAVAGCILDGVFSRAALWDAEVIAVDVLIPGGTANPRARGVLPIAVLGGPTFDAATIDWSSVEVGRGAATEVHRQGHITDIDDDGDEDLLLHVRMADVQLRCGDTDVGVTGSTHDGVEFQGAANVRLVGCGRG